MLGGLWATAGFLDSLSVTVVGAFLVVEAFGILFTRLYGMVQGKGTQGTKLGEEVEGQSWRQSWDANRTPESDLRPNLQNRPNLPFPT